MFEALRGRRPSWRAVTLLVVVVLIGLWRLTSDISGTVDVEDGEPTVPTVVLTAVEEVALDGGWERVDLPGRGPLRDVWDVGGTLFAVGWDDAAQRTFMWSSPDGVIWLPLPAEEGNFDASIINDMIGFNGLVIAVGARMLPGDGDSPPIVVPSVWRSVDGEAFFPVTALEVELWPEEAAVVVAGGFTSIESFGEGLIIGGWEGAGDLLSGDDATLGAVWQSGDAVTFTHSVDAPDSLGTEGSIVRTLVSDGESFVAAGESSGRASVWVSADGSSWDLVVISSEEGSSAMAASARPEGTVILGRASEPSDAVELETVEETVLLWGSSTGSFVPVYPIGLEGTTVEDLGVGTFGMIAVGSVSSDGVLSGAIWSSPDGIQWDEVRVEDIPDESTLQSVVVGERAVVAVGEVHGQPSVWVHLVERDEEVVVGVGSLVAPPAWSTVFQQEEATGTAPTTVLRAGDFLYGLGSNEWLWRSRDGDVWTLQDFDSVGLGDANRVLQIVASDAGWVALGEGDGGRLWYSLDGERWARPDQSPRCCTAAVFRDGASFVALVRDPISNNWLRASTPDGSIWQVDETPVILPVTSVDHVASIGPVGLIWGAPVDGVTGVFASFEGTDWFPVGSDQGLDTVIWDRVWDLGGQVVASGVFRNEPVLFRTTNGISWQSLALPGLDSGGLAVIDVGDFGDGLAVLVSYDGGPTRLLTFSGIGEQDEIPLDVASGFPGRWSILVPNDVSLRMAGSDHGRMTIWEWIPAP
jgi:hypothetical protein